MSRIQEPQYRVVLIRRPQNWQPRSLLDCPPAIEIVGTLLCAARRRAAKEVARSYNLAPEPSLWAALRAIPSRPLPASP